MIDTLIEKIKKTGAPICVGLDPRLDLIPDSVKEKAFSQYGLTLKGGAYAVWEFNKNIIDAISDIVPSVKIQVAMYEELGIPGMEVFLKTVNYSRQKGLVVIGDIKRGDIGSTSAAYANAHLGELTLEFKSEKATIPVFDEDFVTVNPYMGSDGIKEFIKNCKSFNRGLFVLLKTSNPSSGEFQDILTDGTPVYEKVAAKIGEWGEELMGKNGYNNVGAVVGATYPEVGRKLREMLPNTYFLVPGYGAQGATAEELGEYFNEDGLGAIINSSRGIIAAYRKEAYASFDYPEAARKATLDMIEDLQKNALKNKRG